MAPSEEIHIGTEPADPPVDEGPVDSPIDVRTIPHGKRHPLIFARFARLAPGEAFTLISNHEPKPLRREFDAAHPGAYTWDYEATGPEWRIRIGRVPDTH